MVKKSEMQKRDAWAKETLSGEVSLLPFGFVCGGRHSSELMRGWEFEKKELLETDRTRCEFLWQDPQSGFSVRCVAAKYSEYPAVEWTVYLKNRGTGDTPLIENLYGMDLCFESGGDPVVIKTIKGDDCSASSFEPIEVELGEAGRYQSSPAGGRPTNSTAFPYFNVAWGGKGVVAVIGWPGQWAADFAREGDNLKIAAGQQETRMILRPGEEIRSNLSVLMFYEGGGFRAQNMWRRFMNDCNVQKPGGKPLGPKSSVCMGLKQSEKTETDAIANYEKHNFRHDYWWMDAGWYPCDGDWPKTGTWEADKARFPSGIKRVADIVHSKGMELVLWFEPERVHRDSWLYREHPEWLIMSEGDNHLLNLGNPEALRWLKAHINAFITDNGIDIYRQDFNIDPLPFWRLADTPGRCGMTENLYVQGLLEFWDSVLDMHPGIVIDTCASGGRRIDLETLRRAFSLLRSDFQEPPFPGRADMFSGNQGHTYGLAMWLPYYGTGCFYEDRYSFLCHMCPSMGMGYNCYEEAKTASVDWDMLHDTKRVWQTVADNFCGDFYQLTGYSLSEDVWMAWQFDRPEAGEGFVQAFRRENAPAETMCFALFGLDEAANYEVIDVQKEEKSVVAGTRLMREGLCVTLPKTRQAAVILYRKL